MHTLERLADIVTTPAEATTEAPPLREVEGRIRVKNVSFRYPDGQDVLRRVNLRLEAGKTYSWCACGRSQKQPFCDGSHKGTGMAPMVEKIDAARKVAWCGCKFTGRPPFCDGSHGELP